MSLFFMINYKVEDDAYKPKKIETQAHIPLKVQTNKEQLNKLINHYLRKQDLNGAIHYEVKLDEDVELYGTMPVFSQEVQMKLAFEPTALENGDILLQQKSIAVGQLQLPVSYVLKFIKDKYNLPDWVSIQPSSESIYVSMQELKLKNDIHVKVDQFDLINDQIQFTLLVPIK